MEINATMNATQDVNAWTLTVPAFISVAILLCWRLWPSSLDPQEPPLVPSKVPFIGHAIGMLRQQQRYLEALRYEDIPHNLA
jgi:hypothetical protein